MAQTKNSAASKVSLSRFGKQYERFEKWGRPLLYTFAAFCVAYLFFGEPYLYSAWRRSESVGELRVKSEIERRDKWGRLSEAEGKIEIYVGDKVDADFKEGGLFVDHEGHEQAVNYPFRVQQSSQGEILFSPLARRNGNVTWVQRKPQRLIPAWNEILATWAQLKTEWTTHKAKFPLRKEASVTARGKGRVQSAKTKMKSKGR